MCLGISQMAGCAVTMPRSCYAGKECAMASKYELQDVMEALVGLDARVNQCIELVQGVEVLVEELQHAVDDVQELLENVSGVEGA